MNPFEGKSPTERNKIIAALVLGTLALGSLFFAFGGFGMFSSSTTVSVTTQTPTPSPTSTVPLNARDFSIPSQGDQDFGYSTTPIVCCGTSPGPDPGRNIFAFYEPPAPTPYVPTPTPPPTPPPPTPTPEIMITVVNPQSVYAGSRGFRLEITGERMLADARIYLSQSELRTTYVNEQRMTAEVPANFITSEGPRQIIIQTPDGRKYSNAMSLNVQAPPKPQFQYIGMIARKLSNNDTAYFMETGRQTPISARLNDIVGGRFRLISISAEETIFEDVNLSFKHPVPLFRPPPGTAVSTVPTGRPGIQGGENYVPYTPPNTNFQIQPGQSIPGIPDNIPRYVPPNNTNTSNRPPARTQKSDVDDEDGEDKP